MTIQDSVVIVTGANRGLGLEFAQEALRRGARKVYAGVRNPTDANTPGLVQVKLDVTDPASIAAAAAQCGDTTDDFTKDVKRSLNAEQPMYLNPPAIG